MAAGKDRTTKRITRMTDKHTTVDLTRNKSTLCCDCHNKPKYLHFQRCEQCKVISDLNKIQKRESSQNKSIPNLLNRFDQVHPLLQKDLEKMDTYIFKKGIIIIAPSGTGKSYMAKKGMWIDGDLLVDWPETERFWEKFGQIEQKLIALGQLSQIANYIQQSSTFSVIAFNPNLNGLDEFSCPNNIEIIFWIPTRENLVRNLLIRNNTKMPGTESLSILLKYKEVATEMGCKVFNSFDETINYVLKESTLFSIYSDLNGVNGSATNTDDHARKLDPCHFCKKEDPGHIGSKCPLKSRKNKQDLLSELLSDYDVDKLQQGDDLLFKLVKKKVLSAILQNQGIMNITSRLFLTSPNPVESHVMDTIVFTNTNVGQYSSIDIRRMKIKPMLAFAKAGADSPTFLYFTVWLSHTATFSRPARLQYTGSDYGYAQNSSIPYSTDICSVGFMHTLICNESFNLALPEIEMIFPDNYCLRRSIIEGQNIYIHCLYGSDVALTSLLALTMNMEFDAARSINPTSVLVPTPLDTNIVSSIPMDVYNTAGSFVNVLAAQVGSGTSTLYPLFVSGTFSQSTNDVYNVSVVGTPSPDTDVVSPDPPKRLEGSFNPYGNGQTDIMQQMKQDFYMMCATPTSKVRGVIITRADVAKAMQESESNQSSYSVEDKVEEVLGYTRIDTDIKKTDYSNLPSTSPYFNMYTILSSIKYYVDESFEELADEIVSKDKEVIPHNRNNPNSQTIGNNINRGNENAAHKQSRLEKKLEKEKKEKEDNELLTAAQLLAKHKHQDDKFNSVCSRITSNFCDDRSMLKYLMTSILEKKQKYSPIFLQAIIRRLSFSSVITKSLYHGLNECQSHGELLSLLFSLTLENAIEIFSENSLEAKAIAFLRNMTYDEHSISQTFCLDSWPKNLCLATDVIINPNLEIFMEGSFNPYGNGQTDPVTAAGLAAAGVLGTKLATSVVSDIIPGIADSLAGTFQNPYAYASALDKADLFEQVPTTPSRTVNPMEIINYGNKPNAIESKTLDQAITDRGRIEAGILALMEKENGKQLSRKEADKFLRLNSKEPSWLDRTITGVASLLGENKFIGPAYSGGVLGSAHSIRDLAERLAVEPLSKADALARQHDLMYAIAQDKKTYAKADLDMIEGLSQLPQTPQVVLSKTALQTKNAIDNVLNYFSNSSGFKKDLTKEGIEPNPGPFDLVKLLMAINDVIKRSKMWSTKTMRGITPSGMLGVGGVLVTALHDAYYLERGSKREKTDRGLALTIDGLISACNFFPKQIFSGAGLTVLFLMPLSVHMHSALGCAGPRLSVGIMGASYILSRQEMKADAIIKNLGVNTALANGVVNHNIMMKAWTDGDENDEINPTGGSCSQMLGNILLFIMHTNINCRTSTIHNHVRGLQYKPRQIGALRANLYPNSDVAVANVVYWAMPIQDYDYYTSGDFDNIGCPASLFTNALVVFETIEMHSPTLATAKDIYHYSHFAWGMVCYLETGRMKGAQNAGFVVADQEGESVVNSSWVTPRVDGGIINVIVVMLSPSTRPGALGQNNGVFTTNVFGQALGTAANNPMVVGNAGVNCTAGIRAFYTAAAIGRMSGPASQAFTWVATYFCSKLDISAAYIYAALMSQGLTVKSQVSLTNEVAVAEKTTQIYRTTTAATAYDDKLLNTANYTTFMGTCQDMFGQPLQIGQTRQHLYLISEMIHIRRCALLMNLLTIANEAQKVDLSHLGTIIPMGLYCHLLEISEAVASIHDGFRSSLCEPEDVFSGRYNGPITGAEVLIDSSAVWHPGFVHYLLTTWGLQGYLSTRAIPSTSRTYASPTSMEKMVYDKCWEGTEFYTCVSNDIYRKNSPKLKEVIHIDFAVGGAIVGPRDLLIQEDVINGKVIGNWLQPSIDYTAALIAPVVFLSVYTCEMDSNLCYPMFVSIIPDSANCWLTSYLGDIAEFDILDPALTFNKNKWVVDYTEQPKYGPQYKQPCKLLLSASANNELCNDSVPAFEAFKSVGKPIQAFNHQSIKGETTEMAEQMQMFGAKK